MIWSIIISALHLSRISTKSSYSFASSLRLLVLCCFICACSLPVLGQPHESNPSAQINLLWWEPEGYKESISNGHAPKLPPGVDYHDHFALDDSRGPLPQFGQTKVNYVVANQHSTDQYEFRPGRKARRNDTPQPTTSQTPGDLMMGPSQIVILPPFIDFKARPLCIPTVETVSIINTSDKEELEIFSISTESAHFHSSFPKHLTIPPNSNASISIVFLPRTEGPVDNQLILQTSVGHLVYQVVGQGIQNPYRLRPFTGVKVPADVPFQPSIEIYNPHDTPLYVKEVFTSGDFLHLSLPPAEGESRTRLWRIQPHQRKKIINVTFLSSHPGKYTGFVSIKTERDNSVVHVEVLVVKGGLHRTPEEIDFATLASPTDKRTISLMLLNTDSSPVQVSEIYPLTPDPQLFVNFTRKVVPPNSEVEIASFTYTGRSEGLFNGKLLLRTNDSNPANARMELPYRSRVVHGSLGYLPLNTTFAVGSPPFRPVVQSIVFTNKFNVPLTIHSTELDDPHFEVISFTGGLTAQPGATWPPITIRFLANQTDMMYATSLELVTNVSVLRIPLHCYHGRLSYSVLDSTEPLGKPNQAIDFDVLGVNEIRTRTINLTNPNPVKVPIDWMETDLEVLTIKLDSVWNSHGYATSGRLLEANKDKSSSANKKPDVRPFLELEPGNSAIFTVELSSSIDEEREGSIIFHTAFESLVMTVRYHVIQGSLTITPAIIQFDSAAFPGRLLTKYISAKSTYSRPIHISSITSSDARLIPLLTNTTLQPNRRSEIGSAMFDASKSTLDDNYLMEPSLAAQAGLSRPGEPLTKRDLQARHRRMQVWKRMSEEGTTEIRGTLTVNTDVVMGYTLAFRASLSMPAIPVASSIDFALTQVGLRTKRFVTIHNPSDHFVHAHLLPFASEDEVDPILPMSPGASSFYLPPEALALHLVSPHSTAELGPVYFAPQSLHRVNATLYIKNNLTIFDSVELVGEGGSGKLLFEESGDEVGELLFTIDRAHLAHCTSDDPGAAKKEVVVTKVFRTVNKGNMPVDVRSFSISGRKCEGFGFAVDGCEGFVLGPGEARDLRIAFRPDFSSSLVKRDLHVTTSQGTHSFPLVATLPYDLLPHCVDSQPHGELEETVKNTVKGLMVLVFAMMSLVVAKEYFPANNTHHTKRASRRAKDRKSKLSDVEPESYGLQTTIELNSLPLDKRLPLPSSTDVCKFERLLEAEFTNYREREKELSQFKEREAELNTAVAPSASTSVSPACASAGMGDGDGKNKGGKRTDCHSWHLDKDSSPTQQHRQLLPAAAPIDRGSPLRKRSGSYPTQVAEGEIIAPGPEPRSTAVQGSSGERQLMYRSSPSLPTLPPLIAIQSIDMMAEEPNTKSEPTTAHTTLSGSQKRSDKKDKTKPQTSVPRAKKEERERDKKEQKEREERERKEQKEREEREKKEKEERERKERAREEYEKKEREDEKKKEKERKARQERQRREKREKREREEREKREAARRKQLEAEQRERERRKEETERFSRERDRAIALALSRARAQEERKKTAAAASPSADKRGVPAHYLPVLPTPIIPTSSGGSSAKANSGPDDEWMNDWVILSDKAGTEGVSQVDNSEVVRDLAGTLVDQRNARRSLSVGSNSTADDVIPPKDRSAKVPPGVIGSRKGASVSSDISSHRLSLGPNPWTSPIPAGTAEDADSLFASTNRCFGPFGADFGGSGSNGDFSVFTRQPGPFSAAFIPTSQPSQGSRPGAVQGSRWVGSRQPSAVSSLFSLPAPLATLSSSPPASSSESPPGSCLSPPLPIQRPHFRVHDDPAVVAASLTEQGNNEDLEIHPYNGTTSPIYDPFSPPSSASFFSPSFFAAFASTSPTSPAASPPPSSPHREQATTPSYDLFASHPLGFDQRHHHSRQVQPPSRKGSYDSYFTSPLAAPPAYGADGSAVEEEGSGEDTP